jgi:hypothetical protein
VVVARLAERAHRQVFDQVGQAALVRSLVGSSDASLEGEHGLSRGVGPEDRDAVDLGSLDRG